MLMGFFAAFYDSVLWLGERSGMQERRRRLLACVGRQPSAEDIHRRACPVAARLEHTYD
jgi:hypothetical protein